MNYGEKVKKARMVRNINVDHLAYSTGKPVGYIKNIEKGKVVPDSNTKKEIAKTLNLPQTILEDDAEGKSIGQTICDMRHILNLNQHELSKKTKINQSRIDGIENGLFKPTESESEKIAQVLSMPLPLNSLNPLGSLASLNAPNPINDASTSNALDMSGALKVLTNPIEDSTKDTKPVDPGKTPLTLTPEPEKKTVDTSNQKTTCQRIKEECEKRNIDRHELAKLTHIDPTKIDHYFLGMYPHSEDLYRIADALDMPATAFDDGNYADDHLEDYHIFDDDPTGLRIHKYRLTHNIESGAITKPLKWTSKELSKIESGKARPDYDELHAIAYILGTDADFLNDGQYDALQLDSSGLKVRGIRIAKGMTQVELRKEANIKNSAFELLKRYLKVDEICRIAKVFDVKPDDIADQNYGHIFKANSIDNLNKPLKTAELIRLFMHDRNMTAESLANRTGIAIENIYRYLNNEIPDNLNMDRIADVLELPETLLSGVDDNYKRRNYGTNPEDSTGIRIKKYRLRKHLTVESLSKEIGIDADRLKSMEAEKKHPTRDEKKILEDYFSDLILSSLDLDDGYYSFNADQYITLFDDGDSMPKRVRKLVTSSHMYSYEFAKAIGVKPKRAEKMLEGTNKITYNKLKKIANLFDVPVNTLLDNNNTKGQTHKAEKKEQDSVPKILDIDNQGEASNQIDRAEIERKDTSMTANRTEPFDSLKTGGFIQALRQSLGLSESDLANYIGQTADDIRDYENGKYPDFRTLNAIAQAFNIDAVNLDDGHYANAFSQKAVAELIRRSDTGARIWKYRNKQFSMTQFSRKTGLDEDLLTKFEKGVLHPTPVELKIIADALNVDTDVLNDGYYDKDNDKRKEELIKSFDNSVHTSKRIKALCDVMHMPMQELQYRTNIVGLDKIDDSYYLPEEEINAVAKALGVDAKVLDDGHYKKEEIDNHKKTELKAILTEIKNKREALNDISTQILELQNKRQKLDSDILGLELLMNCHLSNIVLPDLNLTKKEA